MANILTAQQVIEVVELSPFGDGMFKYVRLGDEVRFVDFETMTQHREMVSKAEKSKVTSAGAIVVCEDRFHFVGYGSTTLGVKWDSGDPELLAGLLNRPVE